MSKGTRLLLPHAIYHIITRGNQQQSIFLDEDDYSIYLTRIKRYKKRHSFRIYAYCLMPNHVHIIGQPIGASGLSKFMQGLSRSYTAHFNKRYNKVGHLWQQRFKSKAITEESYLIECIQYVEHNPVRADMVMTAIDYRWSSCQERFDEIYNKESLLNEIQL